MVHNSHRRGSRLGPLTGLLVALVASQAALAEDDFSFEIMEAEVKDADKARYDDARRMLAEERYSDALAVFDEIRGNDKLSKYHQDAEYDAAKALYRMGAYHSSLARFSVMLEVGPEHAHFKDSREWLFFIARRMRDKSRVLPVLAEFTKAEELPAEYASEFNYQLARFHFLSALEQGARGVDVEQSDDTEEEGDLGGFDFGDLDDDSDVRDSFKGGPSEGGSFKERETDGDFDFSDVGGDDDGFSFDLGDASIDDAAGKKKGGKSAKKGKGKKGPPKEKAHKNENPQSAEESLRRALGHITRIDSGFEQYAKALYLKGLTHFALGEFEPSVAAFREVVRMSDPSKTGGVPNPKLREMAFFALARIHYQFEQFRYAIFYYERIDRDSEQWLDALFESSWAYFRLGEYERALGNLVTIQSPFFESEYYPEGHILKAITFYENCRYPEARSFLAQFEHQYGGVVEELGRLSQAEKGQSALFEDLAALEQKVSSGGDDAQRSSALTARILRLAFKDKRLAGVRDAITEVEAERERLAAVGAPFGGSEVHGALLTSLDERRTSLVESAGGMLAAKLQEELGFLKDLNAKLVRIQFEITKQEKEALAASLAKSSLTQKVSQYGFSTATDDERVYWPFLGEYWRDELGTYVYTLTHGCRPPTDDG
jgi:tetratricopeptide (TPR) repeat protein